MCTVQPLTGCAPFELRCFRCLLQCFARAKQCSHINAVIHLRGVDTLVVIVSVSWCCQ